MTIRKIGDRWAVVHGHAKKPGSKRDKPRGSVIATHPSKRAAIRQHVAIKMSQRRRGKAGCR